jgi:hypothetical protein
MMNERIKELIEECTITDLDVNGNIYEAKFDKEKFASLIVLECIEQFAFHVSDNQENLIGRLEECKKVAAHFGVDR